MQSVHKLSDNEQSGVAGVVMDVLQAFVHDVTALTCQQFEVVAVSFECVADEAEVVGKHIGNKYFVFFDVDGIFFHSAPNAASKLRSRILAAPRLAISSIFI